MRISSQFDAGSIDVLAINNDGTIDLNLRNDNAADIRQWFYFCLHGAANKEISLRFLNAATATYKEGWNGYRCVASYDRKHWFRLNKSNYVEGQLQVRLTPEYDVIYFAYFEPYSFERHLDFLGNIEQSPVAEVSSLGFSLEGRDISLITIGRPSAERKNIWLTARQHPGETMGAWYCEGLLDRLLDMSDPVARLIREHACIYLVINMNPDGAVHGNLRTNAAGRNLNREWLTPSMEFSPEVAVVRQKMQETGVDLYLDIHGDEELPYVFFSTANEVPGFDEKLLAQQNAFIAAYCQASPDLQTKHGYSAGRFRDELLQLASKWVAHEFRCVSLTLEMPFKDNANLPDGIYGWSAQRSMALGAACCQAMLVHLQGSIEH